MKFWTAFSIKRAKSLLAISRSTKNDIIKHYQIDPELITVAYPGYDQEKFKKQIGQGKIEEIKRKYKIKGDYLLFLSTLKPSKNIEGLLEAFSLLKDESLLEIAATTPATVDALARVRGVSRGLAEGRTGLALLEAIKQAQALPDS